MGFVQVFLELAGGTSASSFSVTATPSEQSPVSAEGNSVMCVPLSTVVGIDKENYSFPKTCTCKNNLVIIIVEKLASR